jgi:hypothetical protein
MAPSTSTPPNATIAATIGIALLVLGAVCWSWWETRVAAGRARAAALPACVEQLGEEACRAHLEQHHADCARLTTLHPSRGSRGPTGIDQAAYLRCVVLGVDEWVAENGRRQDEQARERARRYPK